MVEVNEGSTLVNFTCTIQSHGVPSNFIAMYWQHWVGNRTVRNLTSDIGTSRFDPASSTFTLSLPLVRSIFLLYFFYSCLKFYFQIDGKLWFLYRFFLFELLDFSV